MGGIGSGQWSRWNTYDLVDNCKRVDVRYLQRNGMLTPGCRFTLAWHHGEKQAGSVSGVASADSITLVYRYRVNGGEWQDVAESIVVEWTQCNYGGQRPWFICPGVVNGRVCDRRVAILYDGGRFFLCRACYRLTYQSQRESAADRGREKAQAIRRRLGGTGSLLEPFPDKPKGMHWRTWERLWEQAQAGEEVWDAAAWAHIYKLDARMAKLRARHRRPPP